MGKTIFAMVIALALAVSLVACAQETPPTEPTVEEEVVMPEGIETMPMEGAEEEVMEGMEEMEGTATKMMEEGAEVIEEETGEMMEEGAEMMEKGAEMMEEGAEHIHIEGSEMKPVEEAEPEQ